MLGTSLLMPVWATAAVKTYHLKIAEQTVNITGKPVQRITVNGQFPAPLLEFEEEDDAVIHVHNALKNQDSSIHWHGLLLPGLMDGVPGFNGFQAIKPNGDFVYQFKVRQSGTYWYHAHSKGQEQDGLYGPLVIYPKHKTPLTTDEKTEIDEVVMLSDFHPSSSSTIQNNLKKDADYYQNRHETLFDVLQQIKKIGVKATWQDRAMWNQMRMSKTDLSDVTGYTFLMNGKTPDQLWTRQFKTGEKLRLRFINASAMSFFDVRIPNLKMMVVAADGQAVKPIAVDEFRIGAAETYDVIVEPTTAHYQIQAESIDRSGFALGALHHQDTLITHEMPMPKARPRALLTMEDMGHASGDAKHGQMDHAKMNHEQMQSQIASHLTDHSKKNYDSMHHEQMNHEQMEQPQTEHSEMHHTTINHSEIEHTSIDHNKKTHTQQNSVSQASQTVDSHLIHAQVEESNPIAQASKDSSYTSTIPKTVDGWANAATPEGHKALQYADLKSRIPQPDVREAEREMVIRLGGNMHRYIWTINGQKMTEAPPLKVKYGERIRLKFVNESMMAHPMHLHGMFMQLENGQSVQDLPNKHTIVVPPGKTVTALLTANELGDWAIHCHLLYHMTAGMMSRLIVAKVDEDQTSAIQQLQVEKSHTTHGDEHARH